MAITVRVIDLGPLKRFVTEDDMRAAGQFILRMQRERIARGEGQRGRKMKRYSRAYAKERAEAGLPTDKRTLSRTGAMLASRDIIEAKATSVRIGFKSKARYVFVNQARTPFVKATKPERQLATEFIKRRVQRRLKANLAEARSRKR